MPGSQTQRREFAWNRKPKGLDFYFSILKPILNGIKWVKGRYWDRGWCGRQVMSWKSLEYSENAYLHGTFAHFPISSSKVPCSAISQNFFPIAQGSHQPSIYSPDLSASPSIPCEPGPESGTDAIAPSCPCTSSFSGFQMAPDHHNPPKQGAKGMPKESLLLTITWSTRQPEL